MKYAEKFKDPRWQKKRLKILKRDKFTCQSCYDGDSTLHVHHRYYIKGRDPWDYPDEALVTLCEECHENETTSRPIEEKSLIDTLKRTEFLSGDLTNISYGLKELTMLCTPDVAASIIGWALSDNETMEYIKKRYFAMLKKRTPGKNK